MYQVVCPTSHIYLILFLKKSSVIGAVTYSITWRDDTTDEETNKAYSKGNLSEDTEMESNRVRF